MEEPDHEMERLVREASGDAGHAGHAHAADDDARAARIADGAWARAAAMRPAPTSTPWPRRALWIAAATIIGAAVGLSFVTSTPPAFAVDGDPVQVLRNGEWATASTIEAGTWVFAPKGTRAVYSHDGGRIDPQPGSVFRVVSDPSTPTRFRVEICAGEANISGGTFALSISGRVSVADAGDTERMNVFVSAGATSSTAPPHDITALLQMRDGLPMVRVARGEARVAGEDGRDLMILGPTQAALAVQTLVAGRAVHRVARSTEWGEAVVPMLARGFAACGADDHGSELVITLCDGGNDLRAVRIPEQSRESAVSFLNLVAADRVAARVSVTGASTTITPVSRREFELRRDDLTLVVTVESDGSATLRRNAGADTPYRSLGELKAANPDVTAAFGDVL